MHTKKRLVIIISVDSQNDTLVLEQAHSSDWIEDLAYIRYVGNFNKTVF